MWWPWHLSSAKTLHGEEKTPSVHCCIDRTYYQSYVCPRSRIQILKVLVFINAQTFLTCFSLCSDVNVIRGQAYHTNRKRRNLPPARANRILFEDTWDTFAFNTDAEEIWRLQPWTIVLLRQWGVHCGCTFESTVVWNSLVLQFICPLIILEATWAMWITFFVLKLSFVC